MRLVRLLVLLFSGVVIFMAHNHKSFAAEAEAVQASYKVGEGLKIGNETSQIAIKTMLQSRFTYEGLEGAPNTDTFAVQKGEIKAEGYVMEKKLRFGLGLNVATRSRATTTAVCTNAGCTSTANAVTAESTSGLDTLNDFYFDWVPTSQNFGIKGGQYKVPFLMQELTSSVKQQFVDRAIATDPFNFKRDLGITFHGSVMESPLTYAVFVMNGDGANTINRNKSVLTGVRFELPILGTYVASESDTEYSENHNLGVGAAYAFNEAAAAVQAGTIAADTKANHGTLDVGYKYQGWSFQGAGMLTKTMEGASVTNYGYNAQVGKFLIPKHLEVAARADGLIFDGAAANQYEYSTGLNYFIVGHGIKLQSDYAVLLNSRGQDLNDHRIRVQMQVVF